MCENCSGSGFIVLSLLFWTAFFAIILYYFIKIDVTLEHLYMLKLGRLHGSFENRVYYDKIIASIMVVFGIGGLSR